MDPSNDPPGHEEDENNRLTQGLQKSDNNTLSCEGVLPGPSVHGNQLVVDPASTSDPIQFHTTNSSHTGPRLAQQSTGLSWPPNEFGYSPVFTRFDPLQLQSIMASQQNHHLPWHPVAPTQFYDGGLGLNALVTNLGPIIDVPVPYAPTDYRHQRVDLRTPGWPDDPKLKRIGEYLLLDFHDNCHGGGLRLFRSLGMSTEEIDEVVSHFKRDSRDHRNHVFYRFHVVYGRKPSMEEANTSGKQTEKVTNST
ncbi:hypothetical protein PG994_013346 [Apiospora phragmitis]|uniref:Uncharacterized protein n=1 Tax=Apiospora phragmitis TaxID=2905665 RepID=A0ABR1T8G1_9PEZI